MPFIYHIVQHTIFSCPFLNINNIFQMMVFLFFFTIVVSWYIFNINSDFFNLVTSGVTIMKTCCAVITFPWGTKRLQFYIILQICDKLVIFSWTWICFIGYLLLVWFKNLVIRNKLLLIVSQVVLKFPLINIGCRLFCLPSICAQTIPLIIVDE